MGRRKDPFSQRSISSYKKQSPGSKIATGIIIITLGIGCLIGAGFLVSGEYALISAPFFLVGFALFIGGIISIVIGYSQKSEQPRNEENSSVLIKKNMDEYQEFIDSINYDNWLSKQLSSIKNEIVALYGQSDYTAISEKIKLAESYKYTNEKNFNSLHFFYQDIINIVYAMRYLYDNAIDDCLILCDKDIALLPKLSTANMTIASLTRKAIIFEKRGQIQEAIAICDYGIEHTCLDNGKPFILRKVRLQKKLEKGGTTSKQ